MCTTCFWSWYLHDKWPRVQDHTASLPLTTAPGHVSLTWLRYQCSTAHTWPCWGHQRMTWWSWSPSQRDLSTRRTGPCPCHDDIHCPDTRWTRGPEPGQQQQLSQTCSCLSENKYYLRLPNVMMGIIHNLTFMVKPSFLDIEVELNPKIAWLH